MRFLRYQGRRLTRRVGRRGTALLFFGFLAAAYAHGLAFPTPEARHNPSMVFLASIAPLWAWSLLWAVVGGLCFVQAFRIRDRLAFAAVAFLMTLFGLLATGAWLLAGVTRGYISAAIWLALAGWIGVIADWPEPPPPPRE